MLLRDWMTVDGVWIGNWICWTLTLVTSNNYDSLTELHTPKITVSTAHLKSSVFTGRCLVVESNGGRCYTSGFLNCPWSQLLAFHFSPLELSTDWTNWTISPRKIAVTQIAQKMSLPLLLVLIARETSCLQSCSLAVAVVLSPVSLAWQ
jgi:hypothetical protein